MRGSAPLGKAEAPPTLTVLSSRQAKQRRRGPCTNADSYSCAVDKKSLLQCKSGKVVLDSQCRGAEGCRKVGDKMRCDTTLASIGDVCEVDDEACSVDGKQLLKCKGLKMALGETCKKGCTVSGQDLHCN